MVKNVTGYDLCKLIAGSWGTLAAMTEVTIKVLPAAETEETLLIRGLEQAQAIAAMTIAMGSACDVSGAAHLPAEVAASIPAVAGAGGSVTALRLEGFSPSVAHRRRLLEVLMKSLGEGATIDASASHALWRAVRDVTPFAAGGGGAERPLWRISTAPNRGAELAARIARQLDAQVLYDWAGGLLGWRSTVLPMPARRLSAPPWPRPEDMPRLSGRRPRCARRPTYSPRRRRGWRH